MIELDGLSTEEAQKRLQKYGLNTLPEEKHNPFIGFLHKFWAPVPWMLEIIILLEILFDYVLCNKYIWVMAFAYFFIYIIRIGFNDWGMVYFVNKGYSKMRAASCIFWFEIGGKRNPVSILFTIGAISALLAMHWNGVNWLFLDIAIIFFIGFFIFGPQMLIGMIAAELPDKKAAATAIGFAGCFAYLGAAIAGGPLGALTEKWGWDGFLLF